MTAANDMNKSFDTSGLSLLSSFVVVANHFGHDIAINELLSEDKWKEDKPSLARLIDLANDYQLKTRTRHLNWHDLSRASKELPAIVFLRNGGAMVLREIYLEGVPRVVLVDPNAGEDAPLVLDETRFTRAWNGDILFFKRRYNLTDENQPFGLRLIAGQVLKDRRTAWAIFISSFVLSLLSISPIVFWRLLLDRVAYYHNLNTLALLTIGALVLVVFETGFTFLRQYFVIYVMRRIDIKFSTYIFDRMIRFPIDYFERTSAGQVLNYIDEFYKIRKFLAEQVFGSVLDGAIFLVVLPVMFLFSPVLTYYVLLIAALIFGWIVSQLPELRRRSTAVVHAEVAKGTFLIETLHGVRTVKAMALDARRRHDWNGLVARAAHRRFEQASTANVVETVVTPLERLMISGALALAVGLAVTLWSEQILVGALVMFVMLAQRLTQPLVQLAQGLTQYDEARIAVRVIAAFVNQRPEKGHGANGISTPLVGRVEFLGVGFGYRGTSTLALDDVSFTIAEGSVFGIMGRSGSGKTTVTRLLQMFHSNYDGLIKVDGSDLRQYDADHLRGSFGVVSQENFLFSGTIRETIAAGKPDASFDEVVLAARLAGAEEFIERLQRGYDTYIYEGSSNLSGGQRQRLAIARALITNPRILILDEATSALDAESEAIVNANLMRIAEGRTMIVVSHRLSSLVSADAILVLERGKVYDIGTHAELVNRCDIYSNLWHQQHQHLIHRPSHEVVSIRPASSA